MKKGRNYLVNIKNSSQRLTAYIYDVMKLSTITRYEMKVEKIDLSSLVKEIAGKLRETDPERKAEFIIQSEVYTTGDPALVRILFENLLDNAWKFTGGQYLARMGGDQLLCIIRYYSVSLFRSVFHQESSSTFRSDHIQ